MLSDENIKCAILNAARNKTKNNKRHKRLRYIRDHCDDMVDEVRDHIINFKVPKHKVIEINDGVSAKKRNIIVPTVEEILVHHAAVNVLKPIVSKSFYEHSYASIPKRGTHAAIKQIERWIRNDHLNTKYCLKLDIKKFFESVDQDVLIAKLDKIIRDKRYMEILTKIIRTADSGIPLGLPLLSGSLTSS